jgi:hypothetical protein
MRELKHAHLVPRDPAKNLEWRRYLLDMGRKGGASKLIQMCAADPVFYINSFVWTLDPLRYADSPSRPFVLYPFQEQALLEMDDAIGKHSVVVRKSRDMGATWIILALFEWRWHFYDLQSFLLASRNKSYVDDTENDKALFNKLDYILDHLPDWLRPKYTRRQMALSNNDNGSKINGESATGDLGRGDRRTAMLWDETAAWKPVDGHRAIKSTSATTACKIINSTPQGPSGAYAEMLRVVKHQLSFHWSIHPIKRRGLYAVKNGVLEILDKEYRFPDGYKFVLDGKYPLRSPWFDAACEELPIPALIAQELEMDIVGSGSQFFDVSFIRKLIDTTTRPSLRTGDLSYSEDAQPTVFSDTVNGKMQLWCALDGDGKLPKGEYCVACDIACGTGASNSVLVVANRETGEKVVEFASPFIRPEEFAVFAVSVSRWANGAYLAWEATGPGREFGARAVELGYRNIYFKRDDLKLPSRMTQIPGFWATPDNKKNLLTEYMVSLAKGKYRNYSLLALNECLEIVFLDDGSIGHARGSSEIDPSGAGKNHADRVIADALCSLILTERPFVKREEVKGPAPYTFAWRRRERLKTTEKKSVMVFA